MENDPEKIPDDALPSTNGEGKNLPAVRPDNAFIELRTLPMLYQDPMQQLDFRKLSLEIDLKEQLQSLDIRKARLEVQALEIQQGEDTKKAVAQFNHEEALRKLDLETAALGLAQQKKLQKFNLIRKYCSIAAGFGMIIAGSFVAPINLPAGSLLISTGVGALAFRPFSTKSLLKGKDK